MLRRPPTSIELKLDDISEYEEIKQNKDKQQKSFNEPPTWQPGPKSHKEIYARVGVAWGLPPECQLMTLSKTTTTTNGSHSDVLTVSAIIKV